MNFIELFSAEDNRGTLSAMEFQGLPFTPKRIFFISEVPIGSIRGQHAHKICEQIIYAIKGSCRLRILTGASDVTITLDSKSPAVHLHALSWCEISNFETSTVLAILASHAFDADDYITSLDDFAKELDK
jgi:UDP-2-acetamido-3-amino-2,3-dideoxy-glucuronate N-acetyltransferase